MTMTAGILRRSLTFTQMLVAVWLLAHHTTLARPMVRHIRSTHEFDRLLEKHAHETGLPVIVDFYSDGCGPCRQMAPLFKKLAKQVGQHKAVFCKVDTNTLYELSSRYQIRSLPTFVFFLNKKKVNQFSGAGEAQLQQLTQQVIRQSERDNVVLSKEALVEFYRQNHNNDEEQHARDKESMVETVWKKCSDMSSKKSKQPHGCVGAAANQLVTKLKKKYGRAPTLVPRFTEEHRQPGSSSTGSKSSSGEDQPNNKNQTTTATTNTLQTATREQLLAELERREDLERDAQFEEEVDDDESTELFHRWIPNSNHWPERLIIIGGGPAGTSAAIYAARAGLQPLVVCPPMGGQLQGKGVDVENYPGLHNVSGPGVIAAMRTQAAVFGAVWEDDVVVEVDVSQRPFRVKTNASIIETHAIIVATGAESNWLNVPGEYELRGGGVSSCAVCDGAIYRGKDVVVVGGGDAAMEDALVLARTSRSVTVLHRREAFRASKVLARRVMEHPHISVRWNSVIKEIVGQAVDDGGEDNDGDQVDLDKERRQVVKEVILTDVVTQEESRMACDAVFVAIGHTPATSFLEGIVEFNEEHPGYVKSIGTSTRTSVPGIFAAGDVTDAVYRQAITSAGSGAAAALDAERWLSEEGLGNEAEEMEAELLADIMGMADDKAADLPYNAYEEAGGRVTGMKESVGSEL